MEIHRARPEAGFAQIPNETLRDPRLSYLARGILTEILSRPDDWNTNADAISTRARKERGRKGEGRDAVRRAFAELTAAGYLYHRQCRGDGGRFITETHVFDTAQTLTPDGTPLYVALADQLEKASPQVAPTTEYQAPVPPAQTRITAGRTDDGSPVVGSPGVGGPGVGKPGPLTKTEDEDLSTKTDDEETSRATKNSSHLTSPVPVEGNGAGLEAWMQKQSPAVAPILRTAGLPLPAWWSPATIDAIEDYLRHLAQALDNGIRDAHDAEFAEHLAAQLAADNRARNESR